ncbi:MAG: thermonuclease family protein [Elusimicrobiaceae bacterium]
MLSKLKIFLFIPLLAILFLSGCVNSVRKRGGYSGQTVETTFSGTCVKVSDGDTIRVLHDDIEEKIRLYGIDAPELTQKDGEAAKDFMRKMVYEKNVTVHVQEKDRYGRLVSEVTVNGKNLSLEIVKVGWAWFEKKYSTDSFLEEAEKEAREKRLGIWRANYVQPPWDYRADQKKHRKKPSS